MDKKGLDNRILINNQGVALTVVDNRITKDNQNKVGLIRVLVRIGLKAYQTIRVKSSIIQRSIDNEEYPFQDHRSLIDIDNIVVTLI